MSSIKKRRITWDEFAADTRQLAAMIGKENGIQGLVGIARGGLVATAILAYVLDIREIKTIVVKSYDETDHIGTTIIGELDDIGKGAGWLFVDDLTDSGQTARQLRKRYPQAKFAAPYAKPNGQDAVDYFVKTFDLGLWLEFPWE